MTYDDALGAFMGPRGWRPNATATPPLGTHTGALAFRLPVAALGSFGRGAKGTGMDLGTPADVEKLQGYLRALLVRPEVKVGKPSIKMLRRADGAKGVEAEPRMRVSFDAHRGEPKGSNAPSRASMTNLLYLAETESAAVQVTHIRFSAPQVRAVGDFEFTLSAR